MDIRRELRSIQQIYLSCSDRLNKGGSSMSKLSQFRSEVDIKISQLRKKSIYIAYKIAEICEFKRVDLHGLTVPEAQELVITVVDNLMRMMTSQRNLRK